MIALDEIARRLLDSNTHDHPMLRAFRSDGAAGSVTELRRSMPGAHFILVKQ